MNATKMLMPGPGLKVRHPDGRHLDPSGEAIELTAYWLRRIVAGDVVEAGAAKAAPKVAGDGLKKRGE